MTSLRYQEQTNQGAVLFSSGNPRAQITQTALMTQVMAEQALKLDQLVKLRDALARAGKAAKRSIDDLGSEIEEAADRRRKAEGLIERMKDRIDQLKAPKSRTSEGTWIPELPSGADNITARIRVVRDVINQRFRPPYGTGCYRRWRTSPGQGLRLHDQRWR